MLRIIQKKIYVILNLPTMIGFQAFHYVHDDSVFQSDLLKPYLEVIFPRVPPSQNGRNCQGMIQRQGTPVPGSTTEKWWEFLMLQLCRWVKHDVLAIKWQGITHCPWPSVTSSGPEVTLKHFETLDLKLSTSYLVLSGGQESWTWLLEKDVNISPMFSSPYVFSFYFPSQKKSMTWNGPCTQLPRKIVEHFTEVAEIRSWQKMEFDKCWRRRKVSFVSWHFDFLVESGAGLSFLEGWNTIVSFEQNGRPGRFSGANFSCRNHPPSCGLRVFCLGRQGMKMMGKRPVTQLWW